MPEVKATNAAIRYILWLEPVYKKDELRRVFPSRRYLPKIQISACFSRIFEVCYNIMYEKLKKGLFHNVISNYKNKSIYQKFTKTANENWRLWKNLDEGQ
jgi:hypothetical protein